MPRVVKNLRTERFCSPLRYVGVVFFVLGREVRVLGRVGVGRADDSDVEDSDA